MIYTNLNNSGEVEAVYAAKRATTTGTPPLLYSSKGYDLEDFLISGNTVQNGTPTPSNPVDVVGCGDRTENLIDTNDPTARNNMYINGNGVVASSGGWWVSGYIPIEQGERYTAKDTQDRYLFYSEKGGTSTFVNSNPKYGFTVPDGINYVRVWGRKNSVMLVKGSTVPSSYVPYGYRIPITCGGVTQNIYLGEVPTTRNIKKLVLDGTENWILYDNNYFSDIIDNTAKQNNVCKCTHLISDGGIYVGSSTSRLKVYSSAVSSVAQNLDEWKAFLANQYAAGTPVTIWYVLAEPETGIVNEPLHKIGDYVDTISLSQSGITVPTIAGTNAITIETTVLPSSISVTTPEKEVAEVYAGINYQNPIYYKSRTLTGTLPLTFKGLGQPLKDYSIIGNAVQNGTPTPDDPIFPQECGDRTENLFDRSKETPRGYLDADNVWHGSTVDSESDFIRVKASRSYTLHMIQTFPSGYYVYVNLYDDNRQFVGNVVTFGTPIRYKTVTPSANGYIRFNRSYKASDWMFYGGTDQIPYEPYGYRIPITCGGETQNIYLNEPLRKIGDYADEIDFKAGTVTRRIKEIVLTGDETYLYAWGVISFIPSRSGIASYNVKSLLCNQYNGISNMSASQSSAAKNLSAFFLTSGRIAIKDTNFNNTTWTPHVQEMYAAGTPVTIWYVLAEDQVEAVTLPQIPTISGQNTLTVETTVQPSSASITGHIKPTGYGQLLDVNDVDIQDSNGTPIFIQG